MSDDWLEIVYLALILIGMLAVASWVMGALGWCVQRIDGWWAGHAEDRAALTRIADTLERIEAERAAGR